MLFSPRCFELKDFDMLSAEIWLECESQYPSQITLLMVEFSLDIVEMGKWICESSALFILLKHSSNFHWLVTCSILDNDPASPTAMLLWNQLWRKRGHCFWIPMFDEFPCCEVKVFMFFDWTEWYSDALWMLLMILIAENPQDHTHVWYHVICQQSVKFCDTLEGRLQLRFWLFAVKLLFWELLLQWLKTWDTNWACLGLLLMVHVMYFVRQLGLFPAHPDQKSLLKNKHCSVAYYTAREWIAAGIFELPKKMARPTSLIFWPQL